MTIYDVTVPISERMPIYEGDPEATISAVRNLANGDAANVSQLCFGAHTGTHVDAPNHFIDGTRRVEELEIERLVGPCRVIELDASINAIGPEHLTSLGDAERVIFKTRNSELWNDTTNGFQTDFTFITPEAARILAGSGVKLVGIDYLSVEKFGSEDHATHRILLEKEIVILEGVDLRAVPAGDYELICLPLKYIGGTGDGAPARTILRTL